MKDNTLSTLVELNADIQVHELEFNKKKAALYGTAGVGAAAAGAAVHRYRPGAKQGYQNARGRGINRKRSATVGMRNVKRAVASDAAAARGAAGNAMAPVNTAVGNARQSVNRSVPVRAGRVKYKQGKRAMASHKKAILKKLFRRGR